MDKPTININMDSEVSQALKEVHGYLDKAVKNKQESLRVGTAALFYIFHYAMKCKAKEKIQREGKKDISTICDQVIAAFSTDMFGNEKLAIKILHLAKEMGFIVAEKIEQEAKSDDDSK